MGNKEFEVIRKCDGKIYSAKRLRDMTPEEVSKSVADPELWIGDEIFIEYVNKTGYWIYVWNSEVEILDEKHIVNKIYVIGYFDENDVFVRYVRKGRNNAISAYDSLSSAKRGLGQTRGGASDIRKLQYKLIEFNTGEVIE